MSKKDADPTYDQSEKLAARDESDLRYAASILTSTYYLEDRLASSADDPATRLFPILQIGRETGALCSSTNDSSLHEEMNTATGMLIVTKGQCPWLPDSVGAGCRTSPIRHHIWKRWGDR